MAAFARHDVHLPGRAYWPAGRWKGVGPWMNCVTRNALGRACTDFGQGDSRNIGITMFDLRNRTRDFLDGRGVRRRRGSGRPPRTVLPVGHMKGGKRVYRLVPAAQAELLRYATANYRKLKKLLRDWEVQAERILDAAIPHNPLTATPPRRKFLQMRPPMCGMQAPEVQPPRNAAAPACSQEPSATDSRPNRAQVPR